MRRKSQGIIPKGFSIKIPFNSRCSSRISLQASKALLTDRIHFNWNNKVTQLQKIQGLEDFIMSSADILDQQRIFSAVDSSFRNIFNKQKVTHIKKSSRLNGQQKRVPATIITDSKKFILNLSKHVLTDLEEAVLQKGLNFSVRNPHSNLDIACAVESVIPKLPRTLDMEFRWRIISMLEKSRPPPTNTNKQEQKA
jgi:hypothetical protein